MKSWDSAKNRVSGVVPVLLLVSSTWDTERCHRYAFARHDGSQTSFAKDLQKNRLAIVFLANVEHTWRRAVVFSSFDECCKRRRSSNEKVEVV